MKKALMSCFLFVVCFGGGNAIGGGLIGSSPTPMGVIKFWERANVFCCIAVCICPYVFCFVLFLFGCFLGVLGFFGGIWRRKSQVQLNVSICLFDENIFKSMQLTHKKQLAFIHSGNAV